MPTPTKLTFVQMSGAPGAGKTTLARAIAPMIDAVVIDHDITKTALLEWDIPVEHAGRASYGVLHALAEDLLTQGRSVIFDSPCFYADLLDRGLRLSRDHGARYRYVECFVPDAAVVDDRLRYRTPMRSQRRGIAVPPVDVGDTDDRTAEDIHADLLENMHRPTGVPYLRVDTSRPLDACIAETIAYIETGSTTT